MTQPEPTKIAAAKIEAPCQRETNVELVQAGIHVFFFFKAGITSEWVQSKGKVFLISLAGFSSVAQRIIKAQVYSELPCDLFKHVSCNWILE